MPVEIALINASWAKLRNATTEESLAVSKALTIFNPNARYTKAYQHGSWDGNQHFFHRTDQRFLAGLMWKVAEVLGKPESLPTIPAPVLDALVDRLAGDYALRDYQITAAKHAIERRRTTLQVPTGGGKTLIGAEIVRSVGGRTLWVVHTKELLKQTLDVLEKVFPRFMLGILGGGRSESLGAPLVLGMVQSLQRFNPTDVWLQQFTSLIVDEAHHASADTWAALAAKCINAHVRIGLSGTPIRRDPILDMRREGTIGPVEIITTTEALAAQGFLATPKIVWLTPQSRAGYPTPSAIRDAVCPGWRANPRLLSPLGHKLFAFAYDRGIIKNDVRNRLILATAARHVVNGEKVLILISRIEHGDRLIRAWQNSTLASKAYSNFTSAQSSDAERKEILAEFTFVSSGLLIASPIFREGVDIPSIDVLILGGGGQSETATLQSIGRVLRPRPDKPYALIYDIIDGANPDDTKDYLAVHSRTRASVYEEQGFRQHD